MARTVLEVVVAADPRSLERGLGRAGKATDKFGKQAKASSHTATLGFKSIGTAAKLAGGMIVASGVASGIRDIAKAAAESEVSQSKMSAQLKALGISYKNHAKEIDNVIQKTSRLAALDDEDLQDAFTAIVRTTGNVSKSMKLTGLAADIARGKHMEVAKAGEVVAKVANGNVGVLKRYGVAFTPVTKAQDALAKANKNATKEQKDAAKETDKAATTQKALAALQKRFAGQAEAYGKTSAGAFEGLGVATENLKETLGKSLAPAMASVARGLGSFIGQLQDGKGVPGQIAEAFKSGFGAIKGAVESTVTASVAAFEKYKTQIVSIGQTIRDAGGTIKSELSRALGVVRDEFSGTFSGGGKDAESFRDAMANVAKALGSYFEFVSGMARKMLPVIRTVFAGFVKTIHGAVQVISGLLTLNFGEVWDGVKNIFAGGIKSVVAILRGEVTIFKATAGKVGSAIVRGITGVVSNLPGNLYSLMGKVGDKFSQIASTLANRATKIGSGIVSGIVSGIRAAGGAIGDAMSSLASSAYDKVKGGGVPFVPGIRTGGKIGADGRVSRFQAGGVVPAFVSPGEEIVHNGQSVTVPGPRVAADSVFTHLPVGAAVLTDHGQSLMAGGASLNQAIAMQAPHFVTGGKVKPKSKLVLGDRYTGDARTTGFDEGLDGTSRSGTFASIIGGGIGRRVKIAQPSTRSVSRSASQAGLPDAVVAMQAFASRESAKGLPYVYGGGHGVSGGWDCSGFVSAILGAGGYTSGTGTTDNLKSFGVGGDGKYVTVGVRGSTGRNAHTMIKLGSQYYESGGGGNGAHSRSGWNGNFPIHRHPGRLGSGGSIGRAGQIIRSRGSRAMNPHDPGFVGWGFRKGGSVASVMAAGDTDAKGVTAAFMSLAKRLADGTRTTFTSLASLIRSASTGAAAARKSGDKVEARRYDSVGNLARYEQGRRMAAPIVRVGTVTASIGRQEGRFASRQELSGVDSGSVAGLTASIGRGENSLSQLEGQRPALKRALSQAKKTKNKKAIGEITKSINDLDDAVLERRGALAGLGRSLKDAQHEAAYAPFDAALAAGDVALMMAQVNTPKNTADDLAALNGSLTSATEAYNKAVAEGDGANVLKFGSVILSLTSSIDSLSTNVADNTAAMQAQNALLMQQNEFAEKAFAVSQTETGVIGRAFASLISGELGGKVGLGLMTPAYAGSGARY